MKTNTLTEHKKLNTLTTALLIRIVRKDGKVLCLSNHYEDLKFLGMTYKFNQSFDISAIISNDTNGIDNGEITGILNKRSAYQTTITNSIFTEPDLMAGLWEKAQFVLYEVNYKDVAQYAIKMKGIFGGFQVTDSNFTIELRSVNQSFREKINIQYTNLCRATFCDDVCSLKKSDWTDTGVIEELLTHDSWIDSSLSNTNSQHYFAITAISKANKAVVTAPGHGLTTGESVVFSGIGGGLLGFRQLNGREYTIAYINTNQFSIDFNSSNFEDDFQNNGAKGTVAVISEYYKYGTVTFTSGNNESLSYDVINYRPGYVKIFTAGRHIFELNVGDTYEIVAGCDSLPRTCFERFNNKVNFDAEDLLPTVDDLASSAG